MNKTKIEWTDYRVNDSRIESGPYILVYCPNHPGAKSKGHMYEHRYVMEKHLKRFLLPNEHVHHKDGDGSNNKLENLEIITPGEHTKLHYRKNPGMNANGTRAMIALAKKRKKPRRKAPYACGCGKTILTPDKKGRERKYLWGHNNRGHHWRWGNA